VDSSTGATESRLGTPEDEGTTKAINLALAGTPAEHEFTDAAAAALASDDQT
jgi:hypothetical protein